MNAAFWKGKTAFVTGHTGFKGSWLSLWLQHMGSQVHGYSLAPFAPPDLFTVANVSADMSHNEGDVRDLPRLRASMNAAQPEIVFHLAAQALVRQGYLNPVDTISTNAIGTMNVLEAVRQTPSVRAVVIVTTDKCYENREWLWPYRENEPLGGRDPYSASKACAEIITGAWRDSFLAESGIAVASARAGNVIGGGDWAADRLVPDALRAWQSGGTLRVRRPEAVRPWQHVLEPLAGYLQLAEAMVQTGVTGAWNFGPADSATHSVARLLDRLAAHWGDGARWATEDGQHPHEAGLLRLDSSRARELLGWRPRYDLEKSLQLTVDWHRHWMDGGDMRGFTLEQIERYMAD